LTIGFNEMTKHHILETLPDTLRQEAESRIQVMPFAPGQIVFRAGDHCQGLPLVLSGSVKVQMTGLSGHSIVLYRMGADDICTLSIGCLMTGKGYRAEAVVEEDTLAAMVPRGLFDRLMEQSAGFRQAVMESYGRRLDDLMLLVEEVAFRRMDERLEAWLLASGGGAGHRQGSGQPPAQGAGASGQGEIVPGLHRFDRTDEDYRPQWHLAGKAYRHIMAIGSGDIGIGPVQALGQLFNQL